MTWKDHKKFIFEVDPAEKITALANKNDMYRQLQRFLKRNQLDTNTCTYEQLVEFVEKCPEFLFKPENASCGEGILKINASEYDVKLLYDKIKRMRSGTMDELLVQHHKLAEVNPSSVNTIRIFTFRTRDHLYYTGAVLRMGTTSFIDNYSAGGVVASIDIKTGRSQGKAENYVGERFEKHPITGVNLTKFEVPNWEEVLDFVYEAASGYGLNYVAWDVAIGEDDVYLVEANPGGMINVIQIAGGGGKKALYQRLEAEWKARPYQDEGQTLKRVYC